MINIKELYVTHTSSNAIQHCCKIPHRILPYPNSVTQPSLSHVTAIGLLSTRARTTAYRTTMGRHVLQTDHLKRMPEWAWDQQNSLFSCR